MAPQTRGKDRAPAAEKSRCQQKGFHLQFHHWLQRMHEQSFWLQFPMCAYSWWEVRTTSLWRRYVPWSWLFWWSIVWKMGKSREVMSGRLIFFMPCHNRNAEWTCLSSQLLLHFYHSYNNISGQTRLLLSSEWHILHTKSFMFLITGCELFGGNSSHLCPLWRVFDITRSLGSATNTQAVHLLLIATIHKLFPKLWNVFVLFCSPKYPLACLSWQKYSCVHS